MMYRNEKDLILAQMAKILQAGLAANGFPLNLDDQMDAIFTDDHYQTWLVTVEEPLLMSTDPETANLVNAIHDWRGTLAKTRRPAPAVQGEPA